MNFTGIFIYVDGSDLSEVVDRIQRRLITWKDETPVDVTIVNDLHPRTPDLDPDDLPDWNLGLNLDQKILTLDILKSAVRFLYDVGLETERDFVIGYFDASTGMSEDIAFFGYESGPTPAAETTWNMLYPDGR